MIFRIDARMLWSSLILCSLVKHQKLSPTTSTNGSLLVCLLLLHGLSLSLRGVSTVWLMRRAREDKPSLYTHPRGTSSTLPLVTRTRTPAANFHCPFQRYKPLYLPSPTNAQRTRQLFIRANGAMDRALYLNSA